MDVESIKPPDIIKHIETKRFLFLLIEIIDSLKFIPYLIKSV